jgi:hypothetical protein
MSPYPRVVIVTALKYIKFHIGYVKFPPDTCLNINGLSSGKQIEFFISS